MSTKDDRLFLITGATGTTGKETAHLLLARGHRVRALVHREDDRSRALAAAGAEIVVGDLLDFHDVSAAVRGVSGAYFCYPIGPGLVDATVIFAQAASEAGVRSVVNMSQISARREAVSNAARQHWLCERLLDRTSLLTTHLRPTFFAEWLIWWWGLEDDKGVLRLPWEKAATLPLPESTRPTSSPPYSRTRSRTTARPTRCTGRSRWITTGSRKPYPRRSAFRSPTSPPAWMSSPRAWRLWGSPITSSSI